MPTKRDFSPFVARAMTVKPIKCRTPPMKMDTDLLEIISQHRHQVRPHKTANQFQPNRFPIVPEAIARAVEYLKSLPPYVEPNQKSQ
jgi:hypothetical protein